MPSLDVKAEHVVYRVGNLRVTIDFSAQAVSVTRQDFHRSARTEDLGQGFLIDRDDNGFVGGVEIVAGRAEQNQDSEQEGA